MQWNTNFAKTKVKYFQKRMTLQQNLLPSGSRCFTACTQIEFIVIPRMLKRIDPGAVFVQCYITDSTFSQKIAKKSILLLLHRRLCMYMYVCMYVCVFANSSQTVRPINFIFLGKLHEIPGGNLIYVLLPQVKGQVHKKCLPL